MDKIYVVEWRKRHTNTIKRQEFDDEMEARIFYSAKYNTMSVQYDILRIFYED